MILHPKILLILTYMFKYTFCIKLIQHYVSKHTVKAVLSGHSKIDKTKILKTKGSILQYFWSALSDSWSWKPIFGSFESSRFTLVLLYVMGISHWDGTF